MEGVIRVLLVDDDPCCGDLTKRFLERENEGFDITTATSATDGLDRLDEDSFDCIVSDYEMPRVDGLEFLEAVRDRDRDSDLPFILFTGRGSEEVASEAISAGISDYLQKESGKHHYTVLANRIENVVSEYGANRVAREERRRRAVLFENASDPIIEVEFDHPTSVITDVNPAFEDIFGFDAYEVVDRTVAETLVPTDGSRSHEQFTRRSQQGERVEASVQRRTAAGLHTFLLRITPFDTGDGIATGAYALYIDVNDCH